MCVYYKYKYLSAFVEKENVYFSARLANKSNKYHNSTSSKKMYTSAYISPPVHLYFPYIASVRLGQVQVLPVNIAGTTVSNFIWKLKVYHSFWYCLLVSGGVW